MFGNLQIGEIIIILILVLLLFGTKRLPELARGLAQGVREFRKALKNDDDPPEKKEEPPEEKGG